MRMKKPKIKPCRETLNDTEYSESFWSTYDLLETKKITKNIIIELAKFTVNKCQYICRATKKTGKLKSYIWVPYRPWDGMIEDPEDDTCGAPTHYKNVLSYMGNSKTKVFRDKNKYAILRYVPKEHAADGLMHAYIQVIYCD